MKCWIQLVGILLLSLLALSEAEKLQGLNILDDYMTKESARLKQSLPEDDPANNCNQVAKQIFPQQIDHFNFLTNFETPEWGQRYSVQDEWYGGPGSPIFIFLAGEANMDAFCFQTVSLRDWAKEFKALYIVLEHRYYGHSLPFGEEATTKSLQYLSSDQALADAANFIVKYNATLQGPVGPWVVFGCSYSAGLAAWFRLKYPHLTIGAVAPSGPVQAHLNYTGYFGHFAEAAGPECSSAVQGASNYIYSLTTTQSGLDQLSSLFNTVPKLQLSATNNTWYFLNQLMGIVGASDQFNNPPEWPLNNTCSSLLANGTDPQAVAARWAAIAAPMQVDEQVYRKAMAVPIVSSSRSWLWQTCTQFSWLKPSYPGTSVFFPNQDLPHLLSYCQSAFGIDGMKPQTHDTNVNYAGKHLDASNVLFTNGFYDPWHLVSITEDVPSPSSVMSVRYDAGHCAPMTTPTSQDPPSLVAARQSIVQFLTTILSQASQKSA